MNTQRTEKTYENLSADEEFSDNSELGYKRQHLHGIKYWQISAYRYGHTHTCAHSHTHTHVFNVILAHYYIHTGRAWSILRALVVVLGLLCVLLLIGIIVLLTKKTGDKTTMLPTNGGQSKTHELIIR